MSNEEQSQKQKESKPWLFKPGQSGNPGGKPKGARNKLQADFLNTLAQDFAAHGKQAIEEMREKRPAEYVRAVASLMPKELEISRPLDDISDDELNAAILAVRSVLAAQEAGARTDSSQEQEQA